MVVLVGSATVRCSKLCGVARAGQYAVTVTDTSHDRYGGVTVTQLYTKLKGVSVCRVR